MVTDDTPFENDVLIYDSSAKQWNMQIEINKLRDRVRELEHELSQLRQGQPYFGEK